MGAMFFDVDGTLIDSRADLAAAVNTTRAEYGLEPVTLERVMSFVGSGARYLFENTLPELRERFDEVWPRYREIYREHMLDSTQPYPGVMETLEELRRRGVKLGINTNKPNFATRQILEHFGMAEYFGEAVVAGGDCAEMKPSAQPILVAAEKMGGHRLGAGDWMVGDNWTDVESGHNAGIGAVYCEFGFGELRDSKPEKTIKAFKELLELI